MELLPIQDLSGSENHSFTTLDYSIINDEVCVRIEFDGHKMNITFGDDSGYKSET